MHFPFGRPILARGPVAHGHRHMFIAGAYPSAFHVAWWPVGFRSVRAIPVDNEPEPFWNGEGADAILNEWRVPVFDGHGWGDVQLPAAFYSGESGRKLDERYLVPL